MSETISQLSIRAMLGGDADYLIPMYQRNYAWDEAEITQLIQDVLDELPRGRQYYIGTLVVDEKGHADSHIFEVIDGQQRLTTLCLLAAYFRRSGSDPAGQDLPWYGRECIRFESRPHSSKTLSVIFHRRFSKDPAELLQPEEINSAILNGYRLIQKVLPQKLKEAALAPAEFADYLFEKVQIMRVRVPRNTDLNHYFEVMNNRGEQLEKHEVLKSRLMGVLNNICDEQARGRALNCLHVVWEACANMERYAQMGFTPRQRDKLFGSGDWGLFCASDFDSLSAMLDAVSQHSDQNTAISLVDIVAKQRIAYSGGGRNTIQNEEGPERFNTVINFQNLLLHVLRIGTKEDVPLDDKRLISLFEDNLLRKADAVDRAKKFIYDLLKCKFLLDQFVVKREFSGNSDAWSLKRLKCNDGRNQYVNTFGDDEIQAGINRRILMLLSALHVSTPTMVYKHWLNAALHHLYYADRVTGESYLDYLESVTRSFVFDRFLARNGGLDYYDIIYRRSGLVQATSWTNIEESLLEFDNINNNLVFNYLDYLLWVMLGDSNERVREYEFTFRSSVEHFYPQTPMPGHDRLPPETLNSFGNLCLISHSKNSTLSNYMPKAKKDHYKAGAIDSIKQWLMMQEDDWGTKEILNHYNEMVGILKSDLQRSTSNPQGSRC